MHLHNLQVFYFFDPVVEKFREVVIDVINLAMIRKIASTP